MWVLKFDWFDDWFVSDCLLLELSNFVVFLDCGFGLCVNGLGGFEVFGFAVRQNFCDFVVLAKFLCLKW